MHEYELRFGHTLDNKLSIPEMAFLGKPYASINSEYIQLAKSKCFWAPILLTADSWRLPVGAYGEDAGPS